MVLIAFTLSINDTQLFVDKKQVIGFYHYDDYNRMLLLKNGEKFKIKETPEEIKDLIL